MTCSFRLTVPGTASHRVPARRRLAQGLRECFLPLRPPHSRRVAPERRRPDAAEAILSGLAPPPAAELDEVAVRNPLPDERLAQRALVELRIAPRSREAPDVDERLHPRLLQADEELLER